TVVSAWQAVIGHPWIGDHSHVIVGHVHEITAREVRSRSARLREREELIPVGTEQSRANIFQIAIHSSVISGGLWSFRYGQSVCSGIESTGSESGGRSRWCHGKDTANRSSQWPATLA